MTGRGVGEKCYIPCAEVWAAGAGSLLASNAGGFGVLVTGKSKGKGQSTASSRQAGLARSTVRLEHPGLKSWTSSACLWACRCAYRCECAFGGPSRGG